MTPESELITRLQSENLALKTENAELKDTIAELEAIIARLKAKAGPAEGDKRPGITRPDFGG